MAWFGIVFAIHFLLCFSLVVLVLLQQGKGADAGMVMGAGAANSILGAGATASFISKLTTGLAVCFMITSIILVKIFGNSLNTSGTATNISGSVVERAAASPVGEVAPTTNDDNQVTIPVNEAAKAQASEAEAPITKPIVESKPVVEEKPVVSKPAASKKTPAKKTAPAKAKK